MPGEEQRGYPAWGPVAPGTIPSLLNDRTEEDPDSPYLDLPDPCTRLATASTPVEDPVKP